MGDWGDVIGVLPLAQAVLMLLLLQRLLAIEPAGQRMVGCLALVAGAALALVTEVPRMFSPWLEASPPEEIPEIDSVITLNVNAPTWNDSKL